MTIPTISLRPQSGWQCALAGAKALLEGGDFSADGKEKGNVSPLGEAIDEGQGSSSLRKVAAQQLPESFTPIALRCHQRTSPLIYRTLQYKRIAHVFSLKGAVSIVGSTVRQLEAFHEVFTLPMVMTSFDDFARQRNSPICPEVRDLIRKIFSHTLHGENLNEIAINGKIARHCAEGKLPLLVCSGWDWHLIPLIFYRHYMIYCNRGSDCSSPGWKLFIVNNRKRIRATWLKNVANRLDHYRDSYLSLPKLIDELSLKEVVGWPMRRLRAGTCTYGNLKVALHALITLACASKNFSAEIPHSREALAKIIASARSGYKGWSHFDRQLVLQDFLIDLKRKDHNIASIDDSEIIGLKAVAHLIFEKMAVMPSLGFKLGWSLWMKSQRSIQLLLSDEPLNHIEWLPLAEKWCRGGDGVGSISSDRQKAQLDRLKKFLFKHRIDDCYPDLCSSLIDEKLMGEAIDLAKNFPIGKGYFELIFEKLVDCSEHRWAMQLAQLISHLPLFSDVEKSFCFYNFTKILKSREEYDLAAEIAATIPNALIKSIALNDLSEVEASHRKLKGWRGCFSLL